MPFHFQVSHTYCETEHEIYLSRTLMVTLWEVIADDAFFQMTDFPHWLWLSLPKHSAANWASFLPLSPPHILHHPPFFQSSSGTYRLSIFHTNKNILVFYYNTIKILKSRQSK